MVTDLILAPVAGLHGPLAAALRAATRAATLLEAAAIGGDLMADSGLDETHAAGYAQGLGL